MAADAEIGTKMSLCDLELSTLNKVIYLESNFESDLIS